MAVTADDSGTNAILRQLMELEASGGGGATPNPAVVPLWINRTPQSLVPSSGGPTAPGWTYNPDTGRVEQTSPAGTSVNPVWVKPPEPIQAYTADYAESAWINLTPEEQEAFAERAQKAGMWEPSDGPYGLLRAWSQAVGMSASYNAARPNTQGQWISPWEALEKLAAHSIAGANGTVNGFTGWRSQRTQQVVKFNEEQIGRTAKEVLQRELGRDPSEDEIRAYTVAANQAAARNPHLITERTRVTKFDEKGNPIDTETEQTVEGERFDPTETIEDLAEGTEEHEAYKAAAVYMPALMQALGSVV